VKITRLKRGYRIQLSDTEFEALECLVRHAKMYSEDDSDVYENERPHVQRIIKSERWATHSMMYPDCDQRIVIGGDFPMTGEDLKRLVRLAPQIFGKRDDKGSLT